MGGWWFVYVQGGGGGLVEGLVCAALGEGWCRGMCRGVGVVEG